jgi:serine/threonine-protein kinase
MKVLNPTLASGGTTGATITDSAAPAVAEKDGAASPMTEKGTVLAGRYSIEALLGAGGMGAVYRARDLELDEIVALKMLRRGLGDSASTLERFKREVKLARRVTHKNVARTFDIGEHAGERFLTMELVDGSPLSALVRSGPLALERVAAIAFALCDGLAAAHASGVVHRDLKPDNVLIAKDGRVVITDFGIARASLAEEDGRTQGGVMGTPAFMAPEQLEGASEIDARADVYALGAILYELYTGERAWSGGSIFKLAADKLTQPPPDPRKRRADLPAALADVVMKCMARDPAARFALAEEVSRAITEGTPSSGDEDAPATTMTPPSVEESRPAAEKKNVAVLPLRNVGPVEDDYLADGLTDDLIDTLSMSPDVRVRARGVVARFKNSERDVCEIGRELGVSVVVEGSVRRAADKVRVSVRLVSVADGFQLWARRFDVDFANVLAVGDEASAAVCQALTLPFSAPARAAAPDAIAVDLYMRGRHEYAKSTQPTTVRAIELLEQARARAPEDVAILTALAHARARLLLFEEREQEAEEVLALAQHVLQISPRIEARTALASVLIVLGRSAEGAAELERILSVTTENADALEQAGRLLSEVGRIDEGVAMLRQAMVVEPSRSALAWECARLGALEGRWEEAEEGFGASPPADATMQYWFPRWRMVGWRRDVETAKALLPLVTKADFHFKETAVAMLSLVAGVGTAKPLLETIEGRAKVHQAKRRRMLMMQLRAEVHAFCHEEDLVLDALEEANRALLFDLAWTDKCPLLAPHRAHPRFIAVRAEIEQRAKAISDALKRRRI